MISWGTGAKCILHGTLRRTDRVDRRVDAPSSGIGRVRSNGLGDAPAVVSQQPINDLDDTRRTPIIDFKGMRACARKQISEINEPRRVGAVVAIDRLIVVTHAKHGATG